MRVSGKGPQEREESGGGGGGGGIKEVKTQTLTYLSQDLCGKYYPTFWGFFLVLKSDSESDKGFSDCKYEGKW